MKSYFDLTDQPIDPSLIRNQLLTTSSGAYNTFEGWVRNSNEGKSVLKLEYKSYDALAQKQGDQIIHESLLKFEISCAIVIHRVGLLNLGDMAVFVGVSAPHRSASFEACRYLIDQVKERVPIWKKEYYVSGASDWIDPANGAFLK